MQLLVRVIEAKDIPPKDPIGSIDPYVNLQLGKQRFKTKVVNNCLNPSWCEEFSFQVDDLKDELFISVLDEDKYFNDIFVGQIKVPISRVFDSPDKSLGTAWYTLRPNNEKVKNKYCGEILLTICFLQSNLLLDLQSVGDNVPLSRKRADIATESPSRFSNGLMRSPSAPSTDEKSCPQTFSVRIAEMFNKIGDIPSAATNNVPYVLELPESTSLAADEDKSDEQSSSNFEEVIRTMEMRDHGGDIPSNLPGGVVLDQLYAIAPHELNSLLFSSDSNFFKSVTDMQGSTELQVGSWKFENGGEHLKRVVTYTQAATKLIKDLKVIEDQIYLKADGKTFAVLSTVSIPDAPYGSAFRTEVLYCITSGPELPSGEQSSRLVVSWRINFLRSTMMKGMIENGARQGITESFEVYWNVLSQNVKPVDVKDISSEEQVLASPKVEQQSDWKLADQYLSTFTVISIILVGLYVFLHISLALPGTIQGLEFVGLELPDSIGELVVGGILVLQGKRVLDLMSRFIQAWVQKGSDRGIEAQGDGWLLTVALIEGSNLAAVDSSGFSNPYVVFICNGKTRTSSIKFQKSDPLWNATSLGHAEINFLKTNISDISDVWVPLQGKLAQACQSKLHLRIFLNNRGGSNVTEDYISKVKKEVGEKIRLRSPQANSVFQKLFGLPPEEFLINDFTCHLKRKMPLQGRLFLSARIIGFYAVLFGRKTKFFFLWEDIEDIQLVGPTLSSMGSPVVIMTLKSGRGLDARHGAKAQDEEGRLKFHFHSFVSFNVARRTIMDLWMATTLSPEQKVQIVEEESDTENLQVSDEDFIAKNFQEDSEFKSLHTEESGPFLGVEDASMSMVYSSVHSIPTSFFMELFGSNDLDRRVMERAGCLNYSHSPWKPEKPDVYQRRLYYKFDKSISRYRGKVMSTQKKSCLSERNGWLVEEVTTFHGVPLGDYFNLHLRYQVEHVSSRSMGCSVQVYSGIAWLKNSRPQKRITKNILLNLQERLLVIFTELEKEFVTRK